MKTTSEEILIYMIYLFYSSTYKSGYKILWLDFYTIILRIEKI